MSEQEPLLNPVPLDAARAPGQPAAVSSPAAATTPIPPSQQQQQPFIPTGYPVYNAQAAATTGKASLANLWCPTVANFQSHWLKRNWVWLTCNTKFVALQ